MERSTATGVVDGAATPTYKPGAMLQRLAFRLAAALLLPGALWAQQALQSQSPAREPIEVVVLPQPIPPAPLWLWPLGAAGAGLLALAWTLHRRALVLDDVVEETAPEYELAPLPPPPPPEARLSLTLLPQRAGLNLISATVHCEVVVANTGDAPAAQVRPGIRLMSAHAGQDAELAAFYAAPLTQPATPTFALGPGEERRFREVAALPHDAIQALEAGGRPMFVPLLALVVEWRDGDRERRAGQAYAVGIEHAGSAKLGPLWLDTPARSYDCVAARPHGAAWTD